MKRQFVNVIRVSAGVGSTGYHVGNLNRGGITFPEARYIEAAYMVASYSVATTAEGFKMVMYKNKTTTIGNFLLSCAAPLNCTTVGFNRITGTISAPTISTSNRLWFNITKHTGQISKISVVLHTRKA
jgi:hypothetical protein